MPGTDDPPATATRRQALGYLGGVAALASCPAAGAEASGAGGSATAGREIPFSSPLSEETRKGRYHCRACGLPVFDARAKYATSTGWPSFSGPLPGAVRSSPFRDTGAAPLTCAACAHPLGDVVALRPLRYSVDGSALSFVPDEDDPSCMA